ncbi:hypothetical protein DHEL01_v208448 [Diaporthe helianthi]|uniref:Uncharacterized protein n=1 Tax=Diaporthe helianthi TaxID=158607 RepID=A0A2P5HSF1_DIAHE|nr:hypothetical protein DHEL01_v208448 [Diaporthe helianthi]
MASSPQYLAHGAHEQVGTNSPILPDGSCPDEQPTTVSAYPDPDQIYSSVSSVFDQPAIIEDDNLLTPVSSAASPPLHQRSKVQSPYHQPQDSPQCPQQPTPPNTSTMYSYSDYVNSTSQASSPMPIQATMTQAPHDILRAYIQSSPGHEEPIPPPQSAPYFGHYSASSVAVGTEPDGLPSCYITDVMSEGPYGLMRGMPDIHSASYTHRPLAPNMLQQPQQPQQPQQSQYRRDVLPISRLSPTTYGRPTTFQVKRHTSRKPSTRKARFKKEQSTSPPALSQAFASGDASGAGEPIAPEEAVFLDHKTPADLRRLWTIREKWFARKGHGMWENIIRDFLGPEEADALSEDKRTQVKANLQMKIHRGVLRHGMWPARNKAALLRAYARWEEIRYNEILRMFMEELQIEGQPPAYEWKSVHVEAELVKAGLEQKQREPSKARRRRMQIPARHRAAGGLSSSQHTKSSSVHQQQRLPPGFDLTPGFAHYPSQHYGHQQYQPFFVGGGHKREMSAGSSSYEMLVEQLSAQPQPPLTDEQHEQLIDECLERSPFETDLDPAMALLERHNNNNDNNNNQQQQHHDDIKMSDDPYPEEQLPLSRPSSSSLRAIDGVIASASASPVTNAQRSAAVARQACGELIKHSSGSAQHSNHHQYASV